MLVSRQAPHLSKRCRGLATAASLQQIQILPSHDIDVFRTKAFKPELPAVLSQHALRTVPAIRKWYHKHQDGTAELNRMYLGRFGAMLVPLEFSDGQSFTRTYQAFSFFLECDNASRSVTHERSNRYFTAYNPSTKSVRRTTDANTFFTPTAIASTPKVNIYLAQAPIADLPRDLQADLPTPQLVKDAGKGDVYDSSIWIGRSPTYTPLHKDPNPNMFVQLAGMKTVRMFRPDVGRAIFAKVQESIGGAASESIRGEEMMQGKERTLLEHEVWAEGSEYRDLAFEATLRPGDALFIPKGWWHSVRGVGKGINGSVNWWFR